MPSCQLSNFKLNAAPETSLPEPPGHLYSFITHPQRERERERRITEEGNMDSYSKWRDRGTDTERRDKERD